MKSEFTIELSINEFKCLLFVVKKEQYRVAREIEALEICDSCDEAWHLGCGPLCFLEDMENKYIEIADSIERLLHECESQRKHSSMAKLLFCKADFLLVFQLLLQEQSIERPEQKAAEGLYRDDILPPECFVISVEYRSRLNFIVNLFRSEIYASTVS